MKRRILRFLPRAGALALPALVLVLIGLSVVSNLTLPTRLASTGRLADLEKARLAELGHLRQAVGDDVWPGWGQLDIPVMVYDAEYAFLVGYPDPPPGWFKMPHREPRGGPWEVVPDDTFEGWSYYRQALPDPNVTPESFTVLVGERWAASMQTKEYMEVAFYTGFRKGAAGLPETHFPLSVDVGPAHG